MFVIMSFCPWEIRLVFSQHDFELQMFVCYFPQTRLYVEIEFALLFLNKMKSMTCSQVPADTPLS